MTSRVPQRADAQRNRQRLLAAAETAFNAHGASASLDDIARAAGIGNATLYRHFPTRAELLEAVYGQRIAELCAAAAELAQQAAPARALREWLRAVAAHVTDRRVLTDAFLASYEGPAGTEPPQFTAWHNALFDAGRPLLAAAQDAGAARRDVDIAELLALVNGVARAGSPAQAERFLGVLLEGITPRLPDEAARTRTPRRQPGRLPHAPVRQSVPVGRSAYASAFPADGRGRAALASCASLTCGRCPQRVPLIAPP
ncbi:MAG TPA: TetR family transcriptional regulator [Streptosporangiaceae bacterium]|nr:TetR family transcriptional regulator [Streptosporangiaceae bacterium]